MANRRKFLAGMGALATGSAAAMGTGAFSSVRANRTVTIDTAKDNSGALLSLDTYGMENADYVSTAGSTVGIKLDSENKNLKGSGVNKDAITRLFNLFKVTNKGSQNVFVYANALGDENFFVDPQAHDRPDDTDDSYGDGKEPNNPSQIFDEISLSGRRNVDGGNFPEDTLKGYNKESFILEPGQSFDFGLYIKHEGGGGIPSIEGEITFNAVAESIYQDFGPSE